jgi:hypothetical protein
MDNEKTILDEGISLKEIWLIIWNSKFLVMIITFLGFILTLAATLIVDSQTNKVKTIIELQWNGLTIGEYPDGTRFDYSNLFESSIYALSLEETNLTNISTNDLRKNITILPIIPNDVVKIIERQLFLGERTSYFATEFLIELDYQKLEITSEKGIAVLNSLIDFLRVDFERKYINRAVIIDFVSIDLEIYDYFESYEILSTQVTLINSAVNSVLPAANNFRSTKVNLSFNDILVRTNLVKTIDLNNIESRINTYLLSNDKDLLITKNLFQLEKLNLKLDKELEVLTNLEVLLSNYSGSTQTILIPGLDLSNQFEVQPYINELYQNIVNTQERIATYRSEIQFVNKIIDRLNGEDPDFIVSESKYLEESYKVEDAINRSKLALESIVNDLDLMLNEYNILITKSVIKPLSSPVIESNINMILYLAIGLVLSGILSLGIVFIKHSIIVSKSKK